MTNFLKQEKIEELLNKAYEIQLNYDALPQEIACLVSNYADVVKVPKEFMLFPLLCVASAMGQQAKILRSSDDDPSVHALPPVLWVQVYIFMFNDNQTLSPFVVDLIQ